MSAIASMPAPAPAPRDDGTITRVVGALARARGMRAAVLNELVRVGDAGLLAEVLRVDGDEATLQIFEETSGLVLGAPVRREGGPLAVDLGPGLLGSVLDGIGRPLAALAAQAGDFLAPGAVAPTLDRARVFTFRPTRVVGDRVGPGDQLGVVDEPSGFVHRILVPPGRAGTVVALGAGDFALDAPIGALDDGAPLGLVQRWPVRRARPIAGRVASARPFLTGQRVFDFLFPVAEGGAVAVPGGFGTGKTVIEQTLAKHGEADVVVYVGCGERGNEMAEVLHDFAALRDPGRDRPLIDRTVLIVNTSNMPVAAREASVYLGLTIAEYFRDQGYRAVVLADSLSRWAEALREIGSRLQEMPGEEGYPTYLASRAARLHERAGRVRCLGTGRSEDGAPREGSLTLISAVSPPSGDFSEPVTQACLRVAGALWALDPSLAHQRQFPAVDAGTSYSLFAESMGAWFAEAIEPRWPTTRAETLALLQRDLELREIAAVVGPESLEDADRLLLSAAAIVRESVLGQSAYDPNDAFSPPEKTHRLARAALDVREAGAAALARGAPFADLPLGAARRAIRALRDAPTDAMAARAEEVRAAIDAIVEAGAAAEANAVSTAAAAAGEDRVSSIPASSSSSIPPPPDSSPPDRRRP
jgi:V/A-type H+-transporting ATPase subunit A